MRDEKNMMIFRLVDLLTFPGVVVHELGHKFFCDLSGVRVFKVCYFRFGDPAGYVVHERAATFPQSFLISVGPFIMGNIFAVLFLLLFKEHSHELIGFVFAWLGLAVAANAFPSSGDARVLLNETIRHVWRNPLALAGFPIALIIWMINKLNFFHFNYIFAVILFWFVIFNL